MKLLWHPLVRGIIQFVFWGAAFFMLIYGGAWLLSLAGLALCDPALNC